MSITELCNLAMQDIGKRSTISDLNENSNEARACKIAVDEVRQKLIAAAPWSFCKTAARLAVLKAAPGTPENASAIQGNWDSSMPQPGWLYAYAMPSDCLKLRYLLTDPAVSGDAPPLFPYGGSVTGPIMNPVTFSLGIDRNEDDEQIRIVSTNARGAIAIYSADVPDPDLWDSDFREAYVASLAVKLSFTLTGDKALVGNLMKVAQVKVSEALVTDANSSLTVYDSLASGLWAREAAFNQSMNPSVVVP